MDVDSTERPDIPPFGYEIDYLTFGGIYREVALRIVPSTFHRKHFGAAEGCTYSESRSVEVDCFVQHMEPSPASLYAGSRIARWRSRHREKLRRSCPSRTPAREPVAHTVRLDGLSGIKLWGLEKRNLYTVRVRLLRGTEIFDEDSRRFGFREAQFTDHGFELNGKIIKLRGLDRHQTFPWVGQAMPGRVAAARCADSAEQTQMQHRAHLALSAVAALSGRLR